MWAKLKGSIYFCSGDTHISALLDNLFIIYRDPYVGTRDEQYAWIADEEWIYQTIFYVSKEQLDSAMVRLTFHGLDTVSKVGLLQLASLSYLLEKLSMAKFCQSHFLACNRIPNFNRNILLSIELLHLGFAEWFCGWEVRQHVC